MQALVKDTPTFQASTDSDSVVVVDIDKNKNADAEAKGKQDILINMEDSAAPTASSQLQIDSKPEDHTTEAIGAQLGGVPTSVETSNVIIDLKTGNKTKILYPGDLVIKREASQDRKGTAWLPLFGTVMRPEGTDTDNDSEDGEVNDYGKPSNPYEFSVHWETLGRVQKMKSFQVGLVDRLLLRNTRVSNDEGLVGTVTDLKLLTTVQIIGTNHVIERVTMDRLRPISSLVRGQEILYQDWVGVITGIKRHIWFLLDGGMEFYIESDEKDGFVRNDPYWGVGVPCPGIRSKLTPALMKNAKWVSRSMKFVSRWIPPLSYIYSMANCTISKSEVLELEIKWLQVAPGILDPENKPRPHPILPQASFKDMTVIGTPSSETVGINSVRILQLRPEDNLTTYEFWQDAFRKRYVEGCEDAQATRSPPSSTAPLKALAAERAYEVPVKILHRESIVEVTWNDGTVKRHSTTQIANVLPSAEDADFPMGMIVTTLFPSHTQTDSDFYGTVISSDELASAGTRKVNVRWNVKGELLETPQAVSIFDLRPHPIYSLYQRGTIIFPRDPQAPGTRFKAAVVSDINIAKCKMVVTLCSDNSQHEVFPHEVEPLPLRCSWNFFTRKWVLDQMIPPPYQIHFDFHPEKRFADASIEPLPTILQVSNNNAEQGSPTLTAPANTVDESDYLLWTEPMFELEAFAPETHRYYNSKPHGQEFGPGFVHAVEKELKAMRDPSNIPEGIWIRCYENRLDLMSVLMLGPNTTPFEDGIFMFDLQLPSDFPESPPRVHYVSYSYEISPIMSWDGNFCVSSLRWNSKFPEGPPVSYLTSFLSDMQTILFSPEPYFTEQKKLVERTTDKGKENSRLFNELTFIRVLDSTWNMIQSPHAPWSALIKAHFGSILADKLASLDDWMGVYHEDKEVGTVDVGPPGYPLLPASEGFREALSHRMEKFRKITPLQEVHVQQEASKNPSTTALTVVEDITADSVSVPVSSPSPVHLSRKSSAESKLSDLEKNSNLPMDNLIITPVENGTTSVTDSVSGIVPSSAMELSIQPIAEEVSENPKPSDTNVPDVEELSIPKSSPLLAFATTGGSPSEEASNKTGTHTGTDNNKGRRSNRKKHSKNHHQRSKERERSSSASGNESADTTVVQPTTHDLPTNGEVLENIHEDSEAE